MTNETTASISAYLIQKANGLFRRNVRRYRVILTFGCALIGCGQFYARGDTTNGLVAYFPLDETNGLTAFDASGNGHSATLLNFPNDNSQWVSGMSNGALALNIGVTSTNWSGTQTNYEYAAPADPANVLDFSTMTHPAFTLAAWVKGRSGATQAAGAGIIAKEDYGRGGEEYLLDVYNNHFRFFVRGGDGTGYIIQQQPLGSGTINVQPTAASVISGLWQLLVGVYDSTQPSNQMKLYIDGQLVAERNGPVTLFSTTNAVSIGARQDNASDGYNLPFDGTMDEVKIYNRALSSNDVQELYLAGAGSSSTNPPGDFDTLRLEWRDWLNGGTNLNLADPDVAARVASLSASAQTLWTTMNQSPTRTYLWSDLPNLGTDSSQLWNTYGRLKTLALAYTTPGTAQYNSGGLHGALFSALDWMYANYYNETKSEYDNWWHWEIGIPLRLNDITVLLYDQLTPTQITNYMNAVNHFTPAPNGTSANLVWTATVVALRGVIVHDGNKIAIARDSLSTVFPYVTSGDGFYTDGSYVMHSHFPYTGSYGSSLIYYLAPIMRLLHGSPWEITDPAQTNVFRWVYDSFEPVIYKGAMMDIVRGRAMARAEEPGHWAGNQSMNGILQLAQFAPPADASAFDGMLKYWIQTDTGRSFFTDADMGLIPAAKAILADTNIASRGELIGHYDFASMDRVVHLRPGWGFALGLSSSRIANYESINGENLHGWYMGDGETYLFNNDQDQYDGNYWPTVNPYRLPGTTVDTQTRADSSGAGYLSPCTWVGGATLGDFGSAGMDLKAWNSTLVAKKSWFMFDDSVVCLGAGITSSDNRTIETIVENRKLDGAGDNAFTVNGTVQPATLGWSATLANVSWAHLAGTVAGADIGYYFPQPVSLRALRETRTGSWYAIDQLEPSTIYTNNFLTLWFDHGANPNNATYAYYLLPGKSAAQVAAYAAAPDAVILQNTSAIQAAQDLPLGITAANFWQDGSQSVGGITVDRKASVVLQATETNIAVAVADPTQTNTTGITVTLSEPAVQVESLDSGVTVLQTNPVAKFFVNTAGAHGESFNFAFVPAITNFAGFQNEYFTAAQLTNAAVSGPDADPDHDGLPNLLEYALMLNPWQTDTNTLHPHLDANGNFTLTYTQRKLATDLIYRVDVSTNLVTWDTSETQINKTVLSETSVSQTIEVTALPDTSDKERFFRLAVEKLP